MPPLRFFHRLIGAAEEPVPVYYIRGTSTNVNGTETFNVQFIDDGSLTPGAAETITCAVDSSGNWKYEYSGKKIYTLDFHGKTTLLSVELTEDMARCFYANQAFMGCTNLASVILHNATFEMVTNTNYMFNGCTSLVTVDLTSATFESVTKVTQVAVHQSGMFSMCVNLENILWSDNLNFDRLVDMGYRATSNANGIFFNCSKLKDTSVAKFAQQRFTNVVNIAMAFYGCSKLTQISFPNATFSKVVNAIGTFGDCQALTTIDIPNATFEKVNQTIFLTYANTNLFYNNKVLTTLDVPQNSTAIVPTSTAANAPLNLSACPLTYASMLKVANWLSDLTGYSAHTCTFKASAWNALSSAEQANIDAILSAKNWTRAIA